MLSRIVPFDQAFDIFVIPVILGREFVERLAGRPFVRGEDRRHVPTLHPPSLIAAPTSNGHEGSHVRHDFHELLAGRW